MATDNKDVVQRFVKEVLAGGQRTGSTSWLRRAM